MTDNLAKRGANILLIRPRPAAEHSRGDTELIYAGLEKGERKRHTGPTFL